MVCRELRPGRWPVNWHLRICDVCGDDFDARRTEGRDEEYELLLRCGLRVDLEGDVFRAVEVEFLLEDAAEF